MNIIQNLRLTLVVVQASCLCTALTAVHWNGIAVLLTAFTIFTSFIEFTVDIK